MNIFVKDYNMLQHQDLLQEWLINDCHLHVHHIEPLKGDASLRKYYRVLGEFPNLPPTHLILMDAKNAAEKTDQFIYVGKLLESLKVRVPKIYHINHQNGFLLLEDLGEIQLLDILNAENVDTFYHSALDTLATLQKNAQKIDIKNCLPAFDYEHMSTEAQLFIDWFLGKHLQIDLDPKSENLIHETFRSLLRTIESFPQTLIHRDYHSRNLMVMSNQLLGVIDFQDAMYGPRAYDVVSLLKDCYVVWDSHLQKKYCQYFLSQLGKADELESFWNEFQICGLQRHIKVLGIFARIFYRDNKPGFLGDLPRVWNYTMQALEALPQFKDFYQLMKESVEPIFMKKAQAK
jgi:aminoglycoside/choline kinase family phosphotransferase